MFSIDCGRLVPLLDTPAVPPLETWDCLSSRLDGNLNRMLELLDRHQVKATLFWLGWSAARHKTLGTMVFRRGA